MLKDELFTEGLKLKNIYEPQHDKTNKMTCVRASKDSDQLYTHWVAKDPVFLHAVKTL